MLTFWFLWLEHGTKLVPTIPQPSPARTRRIESASFASHHGFVDYVWPGILWSLGGYCKLYKCSQKDWRGWTELCIQATRILDFLLQVLEAEEVPEAQAVLVTGLCKLLLAGMITEPRVSASASFFLVIIALRFLKLRCWLAWRWCTSHQRRWTIKSSDNACRISSLFTRILHLSTKIVCNL